MQEVVTGIIPVQFDMGYFLSSRLYVGASFQYARGLVAGPCIGGSSCGASGLRVGANASYHLPVSDALSPWLGLGVGVDLFAPSQVPSVIDGKTRRVNGIFTGLEFFNVQGGVDLNVRGPVWLGPFATFTVSQYANVNDEAFHFWLIGGLRLQVRL